MHLTTLTLLNGRPAADNWKVTFDVPSGQSLLGMFTRGSLSTARA